MNKTLLSSVLSLAFVVIFNGACASSAPVETADHNSSAVRASEPAADIVGTWVFDLDASDVATPIREKCAAQSNGDSAKQTACWNEISAEAKLEKIRFSKIENGRSVWTSFAHDGKKETLFLEVPVEISAEGSGHVLAKVAGTAKGMQAEMFAKGSTNQIRIELVDAKTIAVADPRKGRLVYSKE